MHYFQGAREHRAPLGGASFMINLEDEFKEIKSVCQHSAGEGFQTLMALFFPCILWRFCMLINIKG